jgi:hypothetical protein
MSRKAELKDVLNKRAKSVGLQQLCAAQTRHDFSKALDRLDPRLLDNDLDSALSICEDFLRTKWRLDGMESQVMNVMMLALIHHKNQPQLCNKYLKKAFDQNPYLKQIAAVIKKRLPDFELAFPGSVAYNRAVIHAQLKKQGAGFDVVNELTVGRINWFDAVNYALDNKDSSMMTRLMRLYVNLSDPDSQKRINEQAKNLKGQQPASQGQKPGEAPSPKPSGGTSNDNDDASASATNDAAKNPMNKSQADNPMNKSQADRAMDNAQAGATNGIDSTGKPGAEKPSTPQPTAGAGVTPSG